MAEGKSFRGKGMLTFHADKSLSGVAGGNNGIVESFELDDIKHSC